MKSFRFPSAMSWDTFKSANLACAQRWLVFHESWHMCTLYTCSLSFHSAVDPARAFNHIRCCLITREMNSLISVLAVVELKLVTRAGLVWAKRGLVGQETVFTRIQSGATSRSIPCIWRVFAHSPSFRFGLYSAHTGYHTKALWKR